MYTYSITNKAPAEAFVYTGLKTQPVGLWAFPPASGIVIGINIVQYFGGSTMANMHHAFCVSKREVGCESLNLLCASRKLACNITIVFKSVFIIKWPGAIILNP